MSIAFGLGAFLLLLYRHRRADEPLDDVDGDGDDSSGTEDEVDDGDAGETDGNTDGDTDGRLSGDSTLG